MDAPQHIEINYSMEISYSMAQEHPYTSTEVMSYGWESTL